MILQNEGVVESIYGLVMFDAVHNPSLTILLCISLGLVPVVVQTLYKAYVTPLRDIQGPWLAKFTRLWLFKAVCSREYGKINIGLHQKYGPIVRVAPNEYSIDDPEAAGIIYRPRDALAKVDSYP